MSGTAPRAASRGATAAERWARRVHEREGFAVGGDGKAELIPRKLSKFELGPSSFGHHKRVGEDQVQAAIYRRERFARNRGTPLVSQLVKDPDFYRIVNATADRGAIQADWPEIRNGGAMETRRLLADLVDQYEDATGLRPIWD